MADVSVNVTGKAITSGKGTFSLYTQPYYITPSFVEYVLGYQD